MHVLFLCPVNDFFFNLSVVNGFGVSCIVPVIPAVELYSFLPEIAQDYPQILFCWNYFLCHNTDRSMRLVIYVRISNVIQGWCN